MMGNLDGVPKEKLVENQRVPIFFSGERGSRTYTFTEYHKTAND